jgi:hypothetical protein
MITLLILIAVVIAYFAFVLIYGSITDYQPPFKQKLEVVNDSVHIPVYDDEFTFLSWNIGYGGLGYKEDFFYDGGKKTRLQNSQLFCHSPFQYHQGSNMQAFPPFFCGNVYNHNMYPFSRRDMCNYRSSCFVLFYIQTWYNLFIKLSVISLKYQNGLFLIYFAF